MVETTDRNRHSAKTARQKDRATLRLRTGNPFKLKDLDGVKYHYGQRCGYKSPSLATATPEIHPEKPLKSTPLIIEKSGANKRHQSSRPKTDVVNPVDVSLEEVRSRHRAELALLENRQTEIIEGFIYIIVNPVWKDSIKIGSAIDYEDRLNTYQTADPYRAYSIVYTRHTPTRRFHETAIHAKLREHRLNGEWFSCNIIEAISVIDDVLSH